MLGKEGIAGLLRGQIHSAAKHRTSTKTLLRNYDRSGNDLLERSAKSVSEA